MSVEATVDRLLGAIERGDWPTVEATYSDDLQVWHNFSETLQTKADNIASLKRARAVATWRYELTERVVVGNRLIQRHTARMSIVGQTDTLAHAALFITVRDNQVVRMDEYLDTGALTTLRAASAKV